VVFTFGSMIHEQPRAITDILLEASHRAGCRAVIQHGWSGLARDCPLPENVYAAGYLPHDWLFQRAAAVIHHGGAGTTASVWRAGVPAIMVPHAWDQPVWAAVGESLGCSPEPLPIQNMDAESLAARLRAVLEQPSYAKNAYLLSRRIRSEGGTDQACRLIENLVGSLAGTEVEAQVKTLAQRSKRRSLLQNRQSGRHTRLSGGREG
jgi:sterol 3beta-glucosyltransferase